MLDKQVPHFEHTEVGMFRTRDGEGFVVAADFAELNKYAQFLEDQLLLATIECDFHKFDAQEQKNMKATAIEQRDAVSVKLQELRLAVLAYEKCDVLNPKDVSEKYDAMLKLAQEKELDPASWSKHNVRHT